MTLMEFAKFELDRILVTCTDDESKEMQTLINKNIMDIAEVFSEQGHSGSTAPYVISAIHKLLGWKPLTPLTGKGDEWGEPYDDINIQQNKRCSAVFRENYDNSTAHYLYGKVFSDDGGETWYRSKESNIPVSFPFIVPDKPEYIVLDKEAL